MDTVVALHIFSAVVLWVVSAYSLVRIKTSTPSAKLLRHVRRTLAGVAGITALSGAGVSFAAQSLSVLVCAQLSLYLLPALFAYIAATHVAKEQQKDRSAREPSS